MRRFRRYAVAMRSNEMSGPCFSPLRSCSSQIRSRLRVMISTNSGYSHCPLPSLSTSSSSSCNPSQMLCWSYKTVTASELLVLWASLHALERQTSTAAATAIPLPMLGYQAGQPYVCYEFCMHGPPQSLFASPSRPCPPSWGFSMTIVLFFFGNFTRNLACANYRHIHTLAEHDNSMTVLLQKQTSGDIRCHKLIATRMLTPESQFSWLSGINLIMSFRKCLLPGRSC
jgi:hypothetical protein